MLITASFSSRLNLLRKLKYMMDLRTAVTIYNSMLRPIFRYCNSLYLKLNNTQKMKLTSLTNRSLKIISPNETDVNIPSLENINKFQA